MSYYIAVWSVYVAGSMDYNHIDMTQRHLPVFEGLVIV